DQVVVFSAVEEPTTDNVYVVEYVASEADIEGLFPLEIEAIDRAGNRLRKFLEIPLVFDFAAPEAIGGSSIARPSSGDDNLSAKVNGISDALALDGTLTI